ncbi:MAG: LodA/GoxA family CTQ-dependent oxidase [Thermomicrobiales bacterium]|nr:LodA/GoxA family CTQ-dependent oxidase [Thermomicrobiales bacterium]
MNRRQLLKYGAFGLGAAAIPPAIVRQPSQASQSDIDLSAIERVDIHPAIGIARVGNSLDEWFLGPELPGPHPMPPNGFKDAAGRIKPQAARFRLYGLDADDQIVAELTTDNADIEWTVHLANTKAGWYNFDLALDIPEAKGLPPAPLQPAPDPTVSLPRNQISPDRDSLRIDPGPRSISGANQNPNGTDADVRFDDGEFLGEAVDIGELRTDDAGRLLVFGGDGESAPAIPGAIAITFANNDLWHDNTSDGPVDASVRIDGRSLPVTGAWVVVAPPNYAPGIQSVVTMYDIMFEVATMLEPELKPERPSFTRMIYPLFERVVQNQWVNAGFLRDFGWGAPSDFLAPATLAMLADPSPAQAMLRQQVFERFRDPAYTSMEYGDIPAYYGDGVAIPPENPRQWMSVLPLQYEWLAQWAAGDFEADWPADGLTFSASLEELPLADQPDALDRAALDECLGGPFHPGCEMTWPMRQPVMYEAPFRLRRRTESEPDWGPNMTSEIALADDGPLSASGPGDVTRWMAVPWQTDTSSCLSRYIPDVDDYLPTFWPARVPNDILDLESYNTVMDEELDPEERQAAFENRVKWLRDLPGFGVSSRIRINAFLRQWSHAGVITAQPGPEDALFPETFWVELGHQLFDDLETAPDIDLPTTPKEGDLAGVAASPVASPVP